MQSDDRSEVLGLWRTPGPDGKVHIPAEKRRRMNSSTTSTSSGMANIDDDVEKGSLAEMRDLEPGSNPPPRTLHHYCRPLIVFRVRTFASSYMMLDNSCFTYSSSSSSSLKRQHQQARAEEGPPLRGLLERPPRTIALSFGLCPPTHCSWHLGASYVQVRLRSGRYFLG